MIGNVAQQQDQELELPLCNFQRSKTRMKHVFTVAKNKPVTDDLTPPYSNDHKTYGHICRVQTYTNLTQQNKIYDEDKTAYERN